jgi:hypothetical protein
MQVTVHCELTDVSATYRTILYFCSCSASYEYDPCVKDQTKSADFDLFSAQNEKVGRNPTQPATFNLPIVENVCLPRCLITVA